MQSYTEIWNNALKILQNEVTSVSYDLWIKSLEPIDLKNSVLYLSTSSETAKNRVLKLHKETIKNSLLEVSADVEDFKVLDPDETQAYINKDQEQESVAKVENVNKCHFIEKYTFDNFVVGNSNKYVYAAARGVAEHPFSKINPLFIYGGVGLGKTHLLHAIGNYLNKNNPELNVLYITCENFTNEYIESLKGGSKINSISAFREKYRNLDVLMIDDIQFISQKIGTQEEFYNTFNDLYQNNKQIIIASDRPPKSISTLEERLESRFSMGLMQDVQQPDIETRIAILRKKAQQEKYSVEDEVINFIAEKCDTNIRELEGILSKVSFYATLVGKPCATMEDVKEALKDSFLETKQNLTTDRIIDCVCKYFSCNKEDLVGKKKNKEIVEPRQICMYLICDMLNLPLTSIGKVFGGRDHTTVIHAREKVTELIKTNNLIKVAVSDLKSLINHN